MNNQKVLKYKNMLGKLDNLIEEKKKLDFRINKLKENINEFEANHLFVGLENTILQKENDKKII